jgi:hypothetical protein
LDACGDGEGLGPQAAGNAVGSEGDGEGQQGAPHESATAERHGQGWVVAGPSALEIPRVRSAVIAQCVVEVLRGGAIGRQTQRLDQIPPDRIEMSAVARPER